MLCLDIKEHEEPSSCKYFGEEYMPLRSVRFGDCQMQTCGQGRVVWLIELLSGRGEVWRLHTDVKNRLLDSVGEGEDGMI